MIKKNTMKKSLVDFKFDKELILTIFDSFSVLSFDDFVELSSKELFPLFVLFYTICCTIDKSAQDDLSWKLNLFEDSIVLLLESYGIEMISVILSLRVSLSVETSLLSESFLVDDVLCIKTESSMKKDYSNVNK